ncbi:MAG: response regulator transcription factor [Acidobacteria bacterium]|nr:response regulator transcription factor [Acidobacteriota bacterium]
MPDDFDLLTHTREGKDIWLNVSTIVLSERRKPLLVHLFRDVTYQKHNEDVVQNILNFLHMGEPPNGDGNSAIRKVICRENALSALTRREIEVLQFLAEGLSTVGIAQRIGVSAFTVRNHVRNTLRKLNLHSKAQAISFVFTNHLL